MSDLKNSIHEGNTKRKVPTTQKHLPRDLRGLAINKHGGIQLSYYKGFPGQKYGAASKGRSLPHDEIVKYAEERGYGVRQC